MYKRKRSNTDVTCLMNNHKLIKPCTLSQEWKNLKLDIENKDTLCNQ